MWKYITLPAFVLTACASASQGPAKADINAPNVASPALSNSVQAPAPALIAQNQTQAQAQTKAQRFEAWKYDFINRAASKGYDRNMTEQLIRPAKFRESAVSSNNNQAEFTKPIWAYVQNAASDSRLSKGRSKLAENRTLFDAIEARYGVDRHVLTGIWGLESAFGAVQGNYNPVDALATFAFEGRRTAFGEAQLFAILDLLKAGDVRLGQLKSSWAGAMGMTQFIPATFRDYAVDFDGDGNKDLWGNAGDALGSAANYLGRYDWRAQEPVFVEVTLPSGFDYSLADGQKRFISVWRGLGLNAFHAGGLPANADMMEARLYIPAGAKGPKLLTFKNFDVIKRYNNSNSYAMGIATLAKNLAGRPGITAAWPEGDTQISFTQKKTLQAALTAQGFDTKGVDGQIGPNSIRAIRAWQTANNVIADGYVELNLYKRIAAMAGMAP